MSTDRHSSSFAASPDETNLFLDIQQEAPLCGHRKRTRIIGSYAILAVGATWILQSLQELIVLLLCSCDVILLAATGMCSIIAISEDQEEGKGREKGREEKRVLDPRIFQQYLVYQVQKIRLQGYYGFSQKLKHIIRLPFATIAYGYNVLHPILCYTHGFKVSTSLLLTLFLFSMRTAAMLLVMAWKPHISILSISMLLRIIMLVEAICAGFFMSVYIGYVHQYNSLDSQPDVLNSLYSPLQQSSALEGLRYHDGGRLSDQQMALLQYQRENLHFLSEEILRLQECLSKYERSDDGSTPQVDLAHLLAARDQELRTLSAEFPPVCRTGCRKIPMDEPGLNLCRFSQLLYRLAMQLNCIETTIHSLADLCANLGMNQLQSELRLARSLIAEGDSEIQRVRTTNNQYVEENERLRAILGEWSTRAAKLERALEAEHMSNLELQKKIMALKSQTTHDQAEPTLQLDQ
ncbi:hypothetical protein DH2020_034485 [Rehmannia glutinosa]|uniref:Uncharacterized protein n=1 Tax=Rehmannia glutinosa TaxID=99300 RepID=A0ABR0VCI9_REHGL